MWMNNYHQNNSACSWIKRQRTVTSITRSQISAEMECIRVIILRTGKEKNILASARQHILIVLNLVNGMFPIFPVIFIQLRKELFPRKKKCSQLRKNSTNIL